MQIEQYVHYKTEGGIYADTHVLTDVFTCREKESSCGFIESGRNYLVKHSLWQQGWISAGENKLCWSMVCVQQVVHHGEQFGHGPPALQ